MKFWSWFSSRGFKFIWQRSKRVRDRYQILPNKAIDRIKNCVEILNEQGCHPTFPTPGIVVQRYPNLIRDLQDSGAEIAVHGYQHLDLKNYTIAQARSQLIKAAAIFKKYGIESYGFRCPYLGFNEGLFDALPEGLFEYSSNSPIEWNIRTAFKEDHDNLMFDKIEGFYQAKSADSHVLVPWMRKSILEIPICIPDDIQMTDGLGLNAKEIGSIWLNMLQTTYQRGELFNLIFHPELADLFLQPFTDVLKQARSKQPAVWISRLYEVSQWWHEKAKFSMEYTPSEGKNLLNFSCSPRATILVKGIETSSQLSDWDTTYRRLVGQTLLLPNNLRPFIGLSVGFSRETERFLQNQGYIVERSEQARDCSIYLDENQKSQLSNEVSLINSIEDQNVPLVRYGRWPDGAKSALCITGDLDALSLLDYSSRIFIT